MTRDTAILPTGEKLNPANPKGAEYYDERQVAYVVRPIHKEKATRVFTSYGRLSADWDVGTIQTCRHDQTGALLGVFEVVGVADFSTGFTEGDVPDRKLAHGVFK